MRPIPKKLRGELDASPFMHRCIYKIRDPHHVCEGFKIDWEHPFYYAKKQVNERWAIVPVCSEYNRIGGKMDKDYHRYVALCRMTPAEILAARKRYPKADWLLRQHFVYLSGRFDCNDKLLSLVRELDRADEETFRRLTS